MPESMQTMSYQEAKRKVESRLGFFSHLTVYVMVNGGLLLLNLAASPAYFWSRWPMLGWAIGLLFHGMRVFLDSAFGQWKQRMIADELGKYKHPPSA